MADTYDAYVAAVKYFHDGLTYMEIIEFLQIYHSCNISLSTLKRWFKRTNLYRRPLPGRRSSNSVLSQAVEDELAGSGSGIGYRRMHRSMLQKGINCRREDVRQLVKQLDPEGVERRKKRRLRRRKYRSPGPNYAWHIDGHDKLKPFGLCIHGAIDGFSRKLLWLEVSSTNKLPELVGKYYLDTVCKLGGVPVKVKADDGTEHAIVEPMHTYFSYLHRDGVEDAFSVISSPQNQRIKCYWSILKRDRIGWWRDFFNDLVELDLLTTSDPVIVDCIRFCFMPLIRKDLISIMEEWNNHIISKSRTSGPTGRPNCMYYLPHLYEAQDCLNQINQEDTEDFNSVVENTVRDVSEEFQEFAGYFMQQDRINAPENSTEALNLYIYLLEKIKDYE